MVRCRGRKGPSLDPWPWGFAKLIQFVCVFQVRGVGLLPPRAAFGRAAAAAAYYRGKSIFTVSDPRQRNVLEEALSALSLEGS